MANSDSYTWIVTSGGSWTGASGWDDVTTGTDPATSVPLSKNSVTISGPTGSIYGRVGGGGNSESLCLASNIDLSGVYVTDALMLGSVTGAPDTASFASGDFGLGAGSQVTATKANLIDGSLTIIRSGASLSASGLPASRSVWFCRARRERALSSATRLHPSRMFFANTIRSLSALRPATTP